MIPTDRFTALVGAAAADLAAAAAAAVTGAEAAAAPTPTTITGALIPGGEGVDPGAAARPLLPGSATLFRLCGLDHEDDLVSLLHGWTRSFAGPQPRFAYNNRLGEGSQGFIFSVFDRDCRREIAFKTLNSSQSDPDDVARFINEAQITAQLEHPGIIPVHDFGVMPSGAVFYTMKRVQGQSLAEYSATRFGHPEHRFHLLAIFLRVCETIAFAHSRGVIHRDLKPRNIMVGNFGEVLVIDWGLAKVLPGAGGEIPVTTIQPRNPEQDDEHGTRSGQAIGTPAYMSPEQARGEAVDTRCDIYSLGVVLYEILAGTSPYQRGDVRRTLDQVSRDVWQRLDRHPHGRELPRSLVAIVHKAMAHHPQQRYQSLDLLIADLQHFIAGQAVSAYRESLRERGLRLIVRHRRSLTALALALALAGTFVALRDGFQSRAQEVEYSSLLHQAAEAERLQQWDEAVRRYTRLIALRPGDPQLISDLERTVRLKVVAPAAPRSPGGDGAGAAAQAALLLLDDDAESIRRASLRYQEALIEQPDSALVAAMARAVGTFGELLVEGRRGRAAPDPGGAAALEQERQLIRSYRSRQLDDLLARAELALGSGAPRSAQLLAEQAALWCPADARLPAVVARIRAVLPSAPPP
jgi:serine/threonine protein kinase